MDLRFMLWQHHVKMVRMEADLAFASPLACVHADSASYMTLRSQMTNEVWTL